MEVGEKPNFLDSVAKRSIMKNGIIRLIGVFALLLGVIELYRIVTLMVYEPAALSVNIILNIVLSWIALYGGYQAIRLKLIGHRLLLVYFAILTVVAIFFIVVIIFAFFLSPSSSNPFYYSISFSLFGTAQQNFVYVLLFFSLCILSLIFLHRENTASNFQPESSQRHFAVIGKILSLLAPGLGGAMVRNLWVGIILFFVYFFLSTNFLVFVTSSASGPIINGVDMGLLTGWFLRVLPKLIVWAFFFQIDLALVSEVVKAQDAVPAPAQELLSEQSSG